MPNIAVVTGQPISRTAADVLKRWLRESAIEPVSWHVVTTDRDIKAGALKAEAQRVRDELLKVPNLDAVLAIGRYGIAIDPELWKGGILKCNGRSGKVTLRPAEPRPYGSGPDEVVVQDRETGAFVVPAATVNAIAMVDPYHYVQHVREGNTRRAVEVEASSKLILSRIKTMDAPVFLPDVTERDVVVVRGLVGLDTETIGDKELLRRISRTARVDPRASTLKMVGLSDGQLSFEAVAFDDDAEPVAWNHPFDAVVTGDRERGWRRPDGSYTWGVKWHDGKGLAHLLGEKDTELKSLGLRVLGRPMMHYDEAGGTDREPSYCVADAATHLDLYNELRRRASPGILNVYDNIERPMLPISARWTMQGVFELDRPEAERVYARALDEIDELTQRIRDISARQPNRRTIDNPDSTDEVAAYVFKWDKDSGKAKPSVDLGSLDAKRDVPGVNEIIERRQLKKQAETYVGAWLRWPFPALGCLWRPWGAWTGRPSVAALQLHNTPPDLRYMLTPRSGKRLVSFDNSQLEVRVGAHISRDPNMIRLLRGEMPGFEDGDIHRWAMMQLGVKNRTYGKIGVFATLYLGTEGAIIIQAAKYGVSPDEIRPHARHISQTLPRMFSGYFAWANRVKRMQRVPGLFGAVLIPPPHGDESMIERERVNSGIQRGAVDIVKLQTLALEAAGYRTVHQIHDEVIIELDEAEDDAMHVCGDRDNKLADHENCYADIKRIMTEAVRLDVPLKVESKYWGRRSL